MPGPPNKRLAVLTCMDARLDPLPMLDLEPGDAHVLRNAGAIVTDDVLRSLEASRGIGTERVIVVGHTDCGVGPGEEERVREALATLGPITPGSVEGYVFDVESRELRPVS